MNILIRADASVEVGTGHVMRCLILASMLKERGANVRWIMKNREGAMIDEVRRQGFQVHTLGAEQTAQAEDAEATVKAASGWNGSIDWVIVDHYGLDRTWEEAVLRSGIAKRLAVIDDLADRPHQCHLLLDQNFHRDPEERYAGLVPAGCRLFLGLRFLLLRPEFYTALQSAAVPRSGQARKILVFFGGTDPTNETEKAIQALEAVKSLRSFQADVVVGSANPIRNRIEEMCREAGFEFHCQIGYLASLMAQADLALGSGGISMWERCFLGLPSIVTVIANNQEQTVRHAAEFGAVRSLGWHASVTPDHYRAELVRLLSEPEQLALMGKRAAELAGGRQKSGRGHPVVEFMMKETNTDEDV